MNFKRLTGYATANDSEMRSSASRTIPCIAKLILAGTVLLAILPYRPNRKAIN